MATRKPEMETVVIRERVPMDYPLPRREWFRTESLGWADRAWTKERHDAAMKDHYKTVSRTVVRRKS